VIVGLGYQAGVGKDTAAKALKKYGFKRLAFADTLKDVALESDPTIVVERDGKTAITASLRDVVYELGWEEAKRIPDVRRYLQNLGVAARQHVSEDVWVRNVIAEARLAEAAGHHVAITDVRFPNEFEAIKEQGGWLIALSRPGVAGAGDHVSEHALADYPWDFRIKNDSTVKDLELKLVEVLGI